MRPDIRKQILDCALEVLRMAQENFHEQLSVQKMKQLRDYAGQIEYHAQQNVTARDKK